VRQEGDHQQGVQGVLQVAAHLERLRRDGFTVVEGAFSRDFADELLADLARLERELGEGPGKNLFEGLRTVRIYNLLARGELYERIPVHEDVLSLVQEVLDKGCLVSSLSAIAIGPGEVAQPIHADDMLMPLEKPHVPVVCNTMWALTDFTEENGATRLLPGTHRAPGNPELGKAYEGSVAAVMPKGSILVFDGSIWHGGGANRTSERRVGIAMNYCAGFIRQQENQQLGIPREVAKRFSPKLRKLVGYGLYRGLIGHIDRCSPVDLLDESGPRPIVGQ
jgi:ectoine hydroxylase-related dioxygenase (phytanoyl-CoA dioxygenase family)